MMKVAEHTIGNTVVEITQLPSLQASKGLVRLSRVLGEALVSAGAKEPEQLFALAMGKLHDDEIEWFARFFEKSTVILVRVSAEAEPGRMKLNLDRHFTESLKDLLTWIALCISHNYLDFLGGSPNTGKGSAPAKKQAAEEVTISESDNY